MSEDRIQVAVFDGDDTEKVEKTANAFLKTLRRENVVCVMPTESRMSGGSDPRDWSWHFSLTIVYIV